MQMEVGGALDDGLKGLDAFNTQLEDRIVYKAPVLTLDDSIAENGVGKEEVARLYVKIRYVFSSCEI